MSYCNFNDAFNINSNFEKTIKGLSSLNSINNSLEQIETSKSNSLLENSSLMNSSLYDGSYIDSSQLNSLYNEIQSDNDSEFSSVNDNYTQYETVPKEELDGTSLKNEMILKKKSNNIDKNLVKNENKKLDNLTHRKCIEIYNNPYKFKNELLTSALKHISKCNICKKEIKKNMISEKKLENIDKILYNNIEDVKLNLRKNNKDKYNIQEQESEYNLENKLKLINDKIDTKINSHDNDKLQNIILENNIAKYIDNYQQQKQLNDKIDKIIKVINNNFTNFEKINEQINNTNNNLINYQQSFRNELFYLYIGIIIIVILILIDIFIRIMNNNKN